MNETAATIWGWGERFEDVRTNSEKYISKRCEDNGKRM